MDYRFRKLLLAHLFSSVGVWLYRLALPLAVYELSGSALQMAIAFALTFLPFALASLLGGVIADRMEHRRVMIASDLVSAGSMAAIAGIAAAAGPLWLLYILVFVGACATPIHHPSFQSALRHFVQSERLARANSMVSSVDQITIIVTPVLTGLAIAALSPAAIFYIVAGLFVASAATVAMVPPKNVAARDGFRLSDISGMVREGFRVTWANRTLREGALLFAATNFSINLFQANAVFFVLDRFALDVSWVGVFFSVAGAGAVLGALVAPALVRRIDCARLIAACTVLAGFMTAPMAWTGNFWAAAMCWAAASIFGAVNVVAYFTYRQQSAPADMLGRSVAVTRLIAFSTIPAAALVGGLVYELAGPVIVVLLCAALRVLAGGLAGRVLLLRKRARASNTEASPLRFRLMR